MHVVSLDPTDISLSAGGAPVSQTVTIENVPADFGVTQVIAVAVGGSNVQVTTGVSVDNPAPLVTADEADPAYTITAATPVQDSVTPTTWTVELTYQA